MKLHRLFAFTVAASTAGALACSQAPAPPTSPAAGTLAVSDAGPDGSTLKVSAPTLVSPVGGIEITDTSPDLIIGNASPLFVPDLQLSYVFEVTNEDGRVVYTSPAISAGANGRTQHEVNMNLDHNERHTWRAWAVYQNSRGPRAEAASFKTFNRFGTVCTGTELDIIACRKAQYGFIQHEQLHEFLERVAYDLNVGGHEHRPYGRLIKDVGANCHGYSCDIICSGQGGGQRQWDVLEDENEKQGPQWSRVPEPTIRPCEPVQ